MLLKIVYNSATYAVIAGFVFRHAHYLAQALSRHRKSAAAWRILVSHVQNQHKKGHFIHHRAFY